MIIGIVYVLSVQSTAILAFRLILIFYLFQHLYNKIPFSLLCFSEVTKQSSATHKVIFAPNISSVLPFCYSSQIPVIRYHNLNCFQILVEYWNKAEERWQNNILPQITAIAEVRLLFFIFESDIAYRG